MAQWLTNPISNHQVACSIPGLAQWAKDLVLPRTVGCRHGSDPELLWLWCRLAVTAPIRPLAWETPYAGPPKNDSFQGDYGSYHTDLQFQQVCSDI